MPLSRVLVLTALLAPLLASHAHADVPPDEGTKRVPVSHEVSGTASIPQGHTLALVTTRRSEAEHLEVRWTGLEGAVDVPSGYMLASRYYALTGPQLVALAKLYAAALPAEDATRKALEGASPEAVGALMAKTPITPAGDLSTVADFFRNGDLVKSEVLSFQTTIDDDDDRATVAQRWTMAGVKGKEIVLTEVPTAVAEKKSGCAASGGRVPTWPALPVALLALIALRSRRDEPVEPVA